MNPTIKSNKYGKYIEAKLDITIRANIPENQMEISEDEAKKLLGRVLECYAGSNDGSELLANANFTVI